MRPIHPLVRTLKGPKNLFESANVRITESYHKKVVRNQNGRKHQRIYSRSREIACLFLHSDLVLQFYN